MEKAVDNLNGALEAHYEKWMTVKAKNAEILWKTEVTAFTTPQPPMGAETSGSTPPWTSSQHF